MILGVVQCDTIALAKGTRANSRVVTITWYCISQVDACSGLAEGRSCYAYATGFMATVTFMTLLMLLCPPVALSCFDHDRGGSLSRYISTDSTQYVCVLHIKPFFLFTYWYTTIWYTTIIVPLYHSCANTVGCASYVLLYNSHIYIYTECALTFVVPVSAVDA